MQQQAQNLIKKTDTQKRPKKILYSKIYTWLGVKNRITFRLSLILHRNESIVFCGYSDYFNLQTGVKKTKKNVMLPKFKKKEIATEKMTRRKYC